MTDKQWRRLQPVVIDIDDDGTDQVTFHVDVILWLVVAALLIGMVLR